MLHITLQRAAGLAVADSNGKSDPYVKLQLGTQKHKSKARPPPSTMAPWPHLTHARVRHACVSRLLTGYAHTPPSQVIYKTLDPQWDETFLFKGVLFELTAQPLKVDAFDRDTFSKDDPLGSATVSLGALEMVDEKLYAPALSLQGVVYLHAQWRSDGAPPPSASARKSSEYEEMIDRGLLKMRTSALGGWKERYFELSEEDLSYYPNRHE